VEALRIRRQQGLPPFSVLSCDNIPENGHLTKTAIVTFADNLDVNQTFTGSGFAAGALAATGGEQTHINALVSPTGTPGEVLIST
ncbi:KDGP aldolase, partial [Salmonella enterica subsp. enterica serovar Virginia]|nr:KDGP aldolase [Salmonella enterica subsp. enterica serovar Virginia]